LAVSCCAFGQTVNYTVQTLAGNGTAGYSGDNGPATSAEVSDPFGVAADSAGNVYIADYGNNRIRKVSSNGTIATVAGNGTQGYSGDNGAATSAELHLPIGVAVDSAGNLYIADTYNQRVRKVSNGTITTVAGNGTAGYSGDNGPATSAELDYPWAVAVDSAGNLYIADYGNNRIRKVSSNGTITTVAGDGTAGYKGDNGPATSAELYEPYGVAVDSSGNLYVADYGNNRIREVSGGEITTVAGNGTAGYGGDNGAATGAELHSPRGVAMDSAGNLYIADGGNQRIREVSSGVIVTVAGSGTPGYSGDNGPATSAELYDPTGVATGSGGDVYIADLANSRIRVLIPSGVACSAVVSPLVLSPGAPGGNFTVTIQTNSPSCAWAVQNLPSWITVPGSNVGTGSGSVTLVVAANPGVARAATISIAGVLVQINQSSPPCYYTLAFGGQAFPAAGGTGSVGVIASSWCPWTASSSLTWVTLTSGASGQGNGSVAYRVAANTGSLQSGTLTIAGQAFAVEQAGAAATSIPAFNINTLAGNGTLGYKGDNGPAASAELNNPTGVAADSAGNLYIADKFNQRIRKVSNGTITTVAGTGAIGYTGDNGPATSAQLYWPSAVALDSAGNLYIADSGNNVIRKVSNGTITTVAGNGTFNYSGDGGPATSAALNYPAGVAVDPAGNLYIADEANYRVRKVSNGTITTFAGDGTQGYTGDNGPATSAELSDPAGVALDSSGNLYIADSNNNVIREVSNGTISTVAGSYTVGYTGDNGPAISAEVSDPTGVAVDAAGNLYIADNDNFVIRVVANGVIATVAGNNTQGYSGDSGPATSAELSLPSGVVVSNLGNLYIADSGNNRIRVGTPTNVSCVATITPFALFPPTSGGSFSVGVQTGATCPWTVQSLPSWITVSGSASGTGSGNATVVVAANAGAARTGTFSISGVSVQVSQTAASCSYALAFGGQAFGLAGGTGSVGVIASSWCSWTASSPVSWVTLTGGATGTGNGTVTYQVAANSGGAQTGSLTIAGLPFTVEQASATVTGLVSAGSMAQLASGGLWNTTITLVNTGATSAEMVLNFFDDNGNPLQLPLIFPQTSVTAPLLASTLDQTIAAGAELVIQTAGTSGQATVEGWGQLLTNGNIGGSAVFAFTTSTVTQEAVVPLETTSASAFVLPFNYTGGYATGVALANLSNQAVSVPVVLRDATGASLGTVASIPLAAHAHTSFMLATNYPAVAGKYGAMELDTPAGAQISALGIRAAPDNAITTIPVLAEGAVSNGSMAQVASGGLWNSTITLVNTSATAAQVTLNFFDDNGNALALPVTYPLSGSAPVRPVPTINQTIGAEAQLVIATAGTASQATTEGWAALTATGGNVGGSAVFAFTTGVGLQEAVVPVETRNPTAFVLPFDNTGGYSTGVALANLTNQAVSIPVVLRDGTGASLGAAASIALAANAHTSFTLATSYPATAGIFGTLELDTPAGGQISALGIRATPQDAITTVPVLAK
jgi:sugar lactone lactonase YvrE